MGISTSEAFEEKKRVEMESPVQETGLGWDRVKREAPTRDSGEPMAAGEAVVTC